MESLTPAMPRPFHRFGRLWDETKRRWARARIDARLRGELKYELRCLDAAGELDGALSNIGLSRGAIPVLLRHYPGCLRRFTTMARRLGVGGESPSSLKGGLAALFGARRRCLFCTQSRRCERWLATGMTQGYAAFCPNAATFERMRERA